MIEVVLLVAVAVLTLAAALTPISGGRRRGGYESTRVLNQQNAPRLYERGQKLNSAGVAAIPVATSSVVPEPPPPPGGHRAAHTEVFVCTCVWRGRNDGLPRL